MEVVYQVKDIMEVVVLISMQTLFALEEVVERELQEVMAQLEHHV